MAILSSITVGNKRIYEVDADPRSSGIVAPVGSMAMLSLAGVGYVFEKVGAANNAWKKISNEDDIQSLQDEIDAINLDLSNYIPVSEKGAANGVATLGPDQKLVFSQVPAIAITDTFVVNSEAQMLALVAEQGDVAVRTDISTSFILTNNDPTQVGNWQQLLSPTDAVLSVNGQTGIVVLTTDDISEGATNLYFTEARVLSTLIASLSLADSSAVVDGDSVIIAFGKVQAQINSLFAESLRDGGMVTYIGDGSTSTLNKQDRKIRLTGAAPKTLVLPDPVAESLPVGFKYTIYNYINALVSIQKSDTIQLLTMFNGHRAELILLDAATNSWDIESTYLRLGSPIGMNMANRTIINVSNPVNSLDAANKNYVDSTAWHFATVPSQMNQAVSDVYFGTFAGDFDIYFSRNGQDQIRMQHQNLIFQQNFQQISAVGTLNISPSADLNLSCGNGSSMTLLGRELLLSTTKIKQDRLTDLVGGTAAVSTMRRAVAFAIPDGNSTATLSLLTAPQFQSKHRKLKITVYFKNAAGDNCAFEKTAHISAANALLTPQDDYTDAAGTPVTCVVDSYSSNTINILLSGLAGMTGKSAVLVVEDEAAEL